MREARSLLEVGEAMVAGEIPATDSGDGRGLGVRSRRGCGCGEG